jgi:hypothetical protein
VKEKWLKLGTGRPFCLDTIAYGPYCPRFQKRGEEPRLFVLQFRATTRLADNPRETVEQKPKKTARRQPKAVREKD